MSSFGTIPLSVVWAMLDHCAPGHTRVAKKHNWIVRFGTLTYPRFPLGEHGARKDPEIQIGHVRNLARHFGIVECAKSQIEQLRG